MKCYYIEKTVNMQLCEGRHNIPQAIDGSIFPMEVNPLDPIVLYNHVRDVLDPLGLTRCKGRINLYVTGLTVALVAVINYCCANGVELFLYHYNKKTGEYYEQDVYTMEDIDLVKEGGYAGSAYTDRC